MCKSMTNDDKNLIEDIVDVHANDVESAEMSRLTPQSGTQCARNVDEAEVVDGASKPVETDTGVAVEQQVDDNMTLANTDETAELNEATVPTVGMTVADTANDESDGNDGNLIDEQPDPQAVAKAARRKKIDKIVNIVLLSLVVLLVVANLLRIFVWSEVTIQQNSLQPTYDPNDKVLVAKLKQPQNGDVVVVYKYDVDKFKAYFGSSADKADGGKYELLIKRVVATQGDEVWIEEVSTSAGTRYALAIRKNQHTYYEFYVFDEAVNTDNYGDCIDKNAGKYVLCDSLDEAKKLYGQNVVQITTDKTGSLLKGRTVDNPLVIEEGRLLLLGDNRDHSNDSRDMGLSYTSRVFGVVIRQTYDE